jgi:two-component system cell cycle sensor histidine kinase/response regulator CckA
MPISKEERTSETHPINRNLLQAAVDASDEGMLLVDSHGVVSHTNARFHEIWNIPPEMSVGKPDSELIEYVLSQLADPQQFSETIDEIYRSRDETSTILHFKDGRVVKRRSKVVRLDGAEPSRIWFFRDVTDEYRALAELRNSEERFRLAFETSPDAININRLSDGGFVSINEGFTSLTGYTADDVAGKTSADISIWADTADREKLVAGLMSQGKVDNLEADFKLKDGRRHRGLMSARIIQLDGEPHILSVTRDITQVRRTEDALAHSEKRFRALFESVSDVVYVHDEKGCLESINPAGHRLLGLSEAELTGTCLRDYLSGESREKFESSLQRSLQGPVEDTATVRAADGAIRYLEYRNNPFVTKDGRTMVSGIARDITERFEAQKELEILEQQLVHAQKMEAVGNLAAGIAHDFNNILQAIYSQAMVIKDKPGNLPEVRKGSEQIIMTVESAAELVRRMLVFSRKAPTNTDLIAVNDHLLHTIQLLERSVPRLIHIETQMAEGLPWIEMDSLQLEQVIMNLGINAADAMPDGGRLEFVTSLVDQIPPHLREGHNTKSCPCIHLQVIDNGKGMDEIVSRRVFEPFFTTKGPGKGTGLGLSTVFGIIKSYAGAIECSSKPGEGTVFSIFLPVSHKIPAQESQAAPESCEVMLGSETILMVDDEPMLLDITQDILVSNGYQVHLAADGLAALECYRRHGGNIDLVLLDLNMPKMDGYQCLKELKRIDPNCKVVVATGYLTSQDLSELEEGDACGVIKKPYAISELLQNVRRALDC